jgi:ribosomal protein L13E
MPIYQAPPDAVAVVRAKLQRAGVSFNSAMSAAPADLRRAAEDEEVFNKLVARLKKRDEYNRNR